MENILFSALPLSAAVQKAVADMGFTTATAIQTQAIPFAMEGRDVLGQAQTGTGKTAAFGIPVIEKIDTNSRNTQAIVLLPTRELAVQVCEELKKLAKFTEDLNIVAIYGGDSYERQNRELRRGAQIVVGTPGRVIDHIGRGSLKLNNVRFVVLDEADEMLNMGFYDDMVDILSKVPDERQTMLFSATMPNPILELTKKFLDDPAHVKIAKATVTASTIAQYYFMVKSSQRVELMARLIEKHDLKLMLVFCNTKRQVDELVEALQLRGLNAEGLHGDLKQSQRSIVMNKFRNSNVNMLIATDVAARGIDVTGVDAVFNYDIPHDIELYVHRIGRTGRAGRSGMSFSFVSARETGKLREIERFTKSKVEEGTIPTTKEIAILRQARFAETLKAEVEKGGLEKYQPMLDMLVTEGLSLEHIAAALVRLVTGDAQESKSPVDEVDVNSRDRDRERGSSSRFDRNDRNERGGRNERFERGGRSERSGGDRERSSERFSERKFDSQKMIKIFINVGKQQKVNKGDILGAVTGETGIQGKNVGAIEVFDKFSFVEIAEQDVRIVMNVMDNKMIKGRKVNLEVAKD